MKEDLIKDFINPERVIVGESGITLSLRGADFKFEQWILKPKMGKLVKTDKGESRFVDYEDLSEEDRSFQDDLVFQRLVRACVKGVTGAGVKLSDNSVVDVSTFMKIEDDRLSEKSFNILMRVLNQDPSLIGELYRFYTDSADVSKFVIIQEKKK